MSTVKRLESGIVDLLRDCMGEYRIGAAWDQEAMKAFYSEDGAVVVQVVAINPAHPGNPGLPDYRAEVAIRGRTSMATDKDKSLFDRIATLVTARANSVTVSELSAALKEATAKIAALRQAQRIVKEIYQQPKEPQEKRKERENQEL